MKPLTKKANLGLLFLIWNLSFSVFSVSEAGSPQKTIAYLAYTDGYWQAWIMDSNGGHVQQVTRSAYDKSRVSWFPDRKHLLVSGNQGKLVKVKISSGKETAILVDPAGMNDAVASPDGKHIAFSLSPAGSIDDNHIWLVNIDGSNLQRLTNMQGLQHEPAWSPDSNWIYFLSGKGGQVHDIWRVSLKTKKIEQLTAGQLYHFDVAVSSKGDLAFSSNRSGNYEIWIQRPKEKPVKVTDHPALDARPAWSPDGTSLMFESTRGEGSVKLWKLDVPDGKPVAITPDSTGARAPVWAGS